MSKHNAFTRSADAIRDLDPALKTSLTQDERQRADAMFAHIVGTSDELTWPAHNRPRRRRARVLIPVGLIAVTAVALPPVITGESAFASWTATPTPLSPADEADAAATCRVALSMGDDPRQVVVLGERRGGWTYVLLEGPGGKGSCLMSDDLVGQREKDVLNRKQGDFFGGYENHTTHQTPPHDGIIETESMGSAVPPRSHRPFGIDTWFARDTWFALVGGNVGSDVTSVTVHPPVGPDVTASVENGRFAAWWPGGVARGENPGVSGAWTYSVTLADGTTRQVEARP